MSTLFSPITLAGLPLGNRIVVAPMCQYSAEDGRATDWHLIHLGHLALSGAALLFTEATAVSPQGRISPTDLGLWSDETAAALTRVIKAIRNYSAIALGVQLAHAGRKASTRAPWDGGAQIRLDQGGWQALAPSPLAYGENDLPPLALKTADLQRIQQEFATAAQRAQRMGVDAIELHAAHGYLLHEFLSPLSNKRDDAYGGALEKRLRFPLEVFEAVRAAVPASLPVGIRISATDWVDGGWEIEQSVAFSKELKARGCAYIHVSSGGLSPLQKIPLEAGYQVPLAERIKRETGMPVIAVGLITEPEQAETIVASGQADLVALARGMLYDPRWPWHAAVRLGDQVVAPKQYLRSQPREYKALFKT
ncbi:MAG TPA: NADH:flavin oxidoreductase/NADH oxidase [Gammaproteobacteria bacterium]|nr:NADH:flavin oxidoreductase/NADH oxidase [Gammaproteobacteria bacterium]